MTTDQELPNDIRTELFEGPFTEKLCFRAAQHIDNLMAERDGHLQSLAEEIRTINRANGWRVTKPEEWGDDYKIPGVLALIHSEVSEALEAFRKDDGENFVEELADILIRVLDLAPAVTVDFDSVVREKLEKNMRRGHKHGGKRI